MSTSDLVVDIVARGNVLGADHTCSPDQVDRILGITSAENRHRRQMWRDYGLVDFFWEQGPGEENWRGTHFTVQLHRLGSAGPQVAAGPIEKEYGPLQPHLPFHALRTALADLGIDLVELPTTNVEFREYWQPESMVSLLVTDDRLDGGVYAVTAPLRAETAARRTSDPAPGGHRIDHLLQATASQRQAWLNRHRSKGVDAPNWWLSLFLHIEATVNNRSDQRAEAARLYMWAVRQAHKTGTFSDAETAIRIASFSTARHVRGHSDDLAGVLPAPEAIVRACLDALPITLDQAQTPCRPSLDDLDAIRASRQAKNLINLAAPHLDRLHGPHLAAELNAWITAMPNLA
ncbi:hypothetical protein [Microbispora sp. H11081]|uniref:hypothetical protein n=1 Tax=Microbispora sp. H11081 TaxID=2729107 RepID=UPI001474D421|nr:hypothetical protein [Microbispora sp. H11081]